ncbi:MAG: ABC transporter ATP-binding protein [Deltaproteobacteria bacterium]|nr:ABC transporter ATP-binding protein [Candidatus Zymogenaceae bacterium]
MLSIEGASINFGGVHALKHVTFQVKEGSIKAIIGPNGAGKTTLFNLISGFYPPVSGKLFFRDKAIHGLKPHQVAALGISRTFQNVELFDNMTVVENVMLGRHARSSAGLVRGLIGGAFRSPFVRREERDIRDQAMKYLDFVGLAPRAQDNALSLPLGHQRYLEIARALAAEPKLLLLDEPAAGLDERETEDLARLIDNIRKFDITIMLVEHDMNLTMDISEEIVVLDHGELIAEGTPREIQNNKKVIEAYLGEDIGD